MFKVNNPPHQPYLCQFSTKSDAITCVGLLQISSIYWSEGSIVWRRRSWSPFYCLLFSLCTSLWTSFSLAATSFHMVLEPGKSFPYINYQIVAPIKMYNMYEEQWFSPFYILCLTVLRDVQGVTCIRKHWVRANRALRGLDGPKAPRGLRAWRDKP